MSLERSACGRYLVDHSASFQATAQENSSHGAFLMHDTAPAAHDYLNCLSDFCRDIVMWSCSYLPYAT